MIQRDEDGRREAIRKVGRVAAVAGLYVAALGPAACLSPVGSGSSVAGAAGGAQDDPTGDWPGWTRDVRGTRYNPAETAITPSTVGGLKLKWSFVFPEAAGGDSSQPAVVGETLYVGSPDANFYALDARTGSTKWVFDRTAIAGPASIRNGPVVADGKVIFGDTRGYLYALNASTGRLVWSLRLSDHVAAVVTGSPLVFDGKVYVGLSSREEGIADDATYPCCTFRGQFVAVSLATGAVLWRRYTVPPAALAGKWPNGVARYEPAGAAVWSTPAIDPASRTIFYGTGQNYTGTTGDGDSVIALNADTGALRWKRQITHRDVWTTGCFGKPIKHCPGLADGTNVDHDFGAAPNIFTVNGRTLVGIGQKSGVYHAFDAATGRIVWQRPLSIPEHNGGSSGIPWGSSYDGRRIYVATWRAKPGTLFALDPATGDVLWQTPNPADGCTTGGAAAHPKVCNLSHNSAVTATPGLVYEGSADGKMRIYGARDGAILWHYDTVRQYEGVNGATGSGGSIAGNGGAVVSHGMLYVQSGYYPWFGMTGRVLLAFGL